MSPTELAQRQLDAYNNHNLSDFLACYHDEVEIFDFPSGELRFRGKDAMSERYGKLFENTALHAELTNRIAIGNICMDEEHVRGVREDGLLHAVAIYEIEDELIRRIWFIRQD